MLKATLGFPVELAPRIQDVLLYRIPGQQTLARVTSLLSGVPFEFRGLVGTVHFLLVVSITAFSEKGTQNSNT